MQRTKTRAEIATQPFLNKTDIQRLFLLGRRQADKVFRLADRLDSEELGDWRIEDFKVRTSSACRITGVSLEDLQKQIKSAPEVGSQERS